MLTSFRPIFFSVFGISLFLITFTVTNLSQNIQIVEKERKFDLSLQYFNSSKRFDPKYLPILEKLGFNENTNFVDLSGPLPPVTFVTATSENHAGEARNLTLRLARDHPTWKVVVYDIGLEPQTRKWFESACNLVVKYINLTEFGVTLENYRWKPMALQEFPVVVWMDTSTHFVPFVTSDQILRDLNPQPSETEPNHYIFSVNRHSTYAVTTKGMYDYLRPQENVYRAQYEASKQLLIRTKSTYELSLKWWILCALEKNCLAPEGHALGCVFDSDRVTTLANCNRYDQSAVNIILLPYPRSHVGWPAQAYLWTFRGHSSDEELVVCKTETRENTAPTLKK